ncbi:hypothetical protein STRCI_008602 [Streptomyces cinnabarinus]|uniref:Uncharacterized protein n=1 Tax=Streptomyces cinnabarinus TaxID=67287 RepID=A0ABY7KU33_9ACTN|nr:hypothetical protein [Streptomyces cinnabarinus]WAZ26922.1 hypothetical protein STRCI_008602 [Streptomyces cinnabarinus]
MAARVGGVATADLVLAANAASLPCEASQGREEVILLLAVAEWGMTAAAMAYTELAEHAARRGVCLIPEE